MLTFPTGILKVPHENRVARSSIGLGHGPLKAERRVRFPYALPPLFGEFLGSPISEYRQLREASFPFLLLILIARVSELPSLHGMLGGEKGRGQPHSKSHVECGGPPSLFGGTPGVTDLGISATQRGTL